MTGSRRGALQPAFLLHHHDYSDSSRILELLTREHGRISLFARGVRRAKSPYRPVLQPFVPLLLSWSGGTDGGNLTGAEFAGAASRPSSETRASSPAIAATELTRTAPTARAAACSDNPARLNAIPHSERTISSVLSREARKRQIEIRAAWRKN